MTEEEQIEEILEEANAYGLRQEVKKRQKRFSQKITRFLKLVHM